MTNNQLTLGRVAGYEVSLELPVWPEKLKIDNGKLKMPERDTGTDFFAPVWEGMCVMRSADANAVLIPSIPIAGLRLRSYLHSAYARSGVVALPWQIGVSRRLEAQISMVLGTILVGLGMAAVALWGGPIEAREARQLIKEA